MADEYWVDITHPRHKKTGNVVGADDYVIIPQHLGDRSFQAVGDREFAAVGKKYRLAAEVETVGGPHHHRSRSRGRYWNQPLFYSIDYGDVPVTVSNEDYELPDGVSGPLDSKKDRLNPGQKLLVNQFLTVKDKTGKITGKLILQADGNLVFYANGHPFWTTNTNGKPIKQAFMQTDGNFVLYDANLTPYWSTNTYGHPGAYLLLQSDGNIVLYSGKTPLWKTDTQNWKSKIYYHDMLGDIVHNLNNVVEFAGKPVSAVIDVAEKIPVVGDAIHAAVGLDPLKALGGIVSSVAHGERLDKAFLEAGRKQIAAVKEIAPYVQTVMSFVPGVGTGVAAAIAAGTALAEGRSITDAVLDGLKGAVPGGAIGKAALTAGLAIVHGNNVASTVVDAVKAQLPPAARQAVDTAIAASGGKNVREAILQGIRANLPADAKTALDVGIAVGSARNAQSAVANALTNPGVLSKLAAIPVPAKLAALVPKEPQARKGFQVATGILKHKGVTPTALAAARKTLSVHEATGFDHAIKSINNHFKQDTHTSLVRGGIVARGNWKAVKSGTKGAIPGRLVVGKNITNGHFVRV